MLHKLRAPVVRRARSGFFARVAVGDEGWPTAGGTHGGGAARLRQQEARRGPDFKHA
jgi:hypothetical protein